MKKTETKTSKAQSVALIIIAVLIVVGLGNIFYQSVVNGLTFGMISQTSLEVPLYSLVTRELSETGESYSVTLEAGFYKVGVHIPEGKYTMEIEAGECNFIVLDEENTINIHGNVTAGEPDGETGYITSDVMNDLWLYEGAILRISDTAKITFRSDNAQLPLIYETNPNSKSDTYSEKFIVGKDYNIPEGTYDITCVDGTGELKISLGGIGYREIVDIEDFMMSEDGTVHAKTYKNVVLTDGTIVEPEEGMKIMLTPSESIESKDYEDYYGKK